MTTRTAPQSDGEDSTPFRLKRQGEFSEALAGYAHLYTDSLERGSDKIAELCFEQMFDTALLMFLKQENEFKSPRDLLQAIESKLCDALKELGHRDVGKFDSNFAECQNELFKRGRGVTRFSVDLDLLITRRQSRTMKGSNRE